MIFQIPTFVTCCLLCYDFPTLPLFASCMTCTCTVKLDISKIIFISTRRSTFVSFTLIYKSYLVQIICNYIILNSSNILMTVDIKDKHLECKEMAPGK